VIRQAERIVWAAGWHVQEQDVPQQLAGTRGLARARLEPRSDVIQLVTYDSEHIGHVRREGPPGQEEQWVAVLRHQARLVGTYGSAGAAAALAQACGKTTRKRAESAFGGTPRPPGPGASRVNGQVDGLTRSLARYDRRIGEIAV
jgi:hypothetical protein